MDISEVHELAGKLYHAAGPGDVEAQIVDARPADRFTGKVAETRPGVRSGGIKNALNVPFGSLLAADGTLKSGDDLQAIFSAAGVELNKDTIHSCGSGVTACVVDLSMREHIARDVSDQPV